MSLRLRRAYGSQFAAVVALVSASALVYLNSLWNGFVYDDKALVVENLSIREWPAVLSRLSLYRPLRWFTYAGEYRLWGLNPFGFHLTNVLLHVSCTLLLYLLGSKLFKGRFTPLVIALLFAVHPVGTEAVNGIASRPDLLASMFLLSCFLFYMSKGRSIWLYVLSLFSFLLALLSKEAVAIAIPAILVGSDLYSTRAVNAVGVIRRNIRYYVAYGVVGALFIAAGSYRLEVSEQVSAVSRYLENSASLARGSHTMVLGIWAKAVSENLRLLFLPYNLCADYPFPHVSSLLEPSVILSFLVCIGFVVIIVKTYARWRGVSFGLFWIFVTLMPVSNLIPLTPHFVAERYLYVPSMGFCMVLGIVIDGIRRTRTRSLSPAFREMVAVALLIAIVTSYCVLTVRRNYDWRSDYVLWLKTARQQPQSVPAHINLGAAYTKRSLFEDATREFEKAIQIAPGFASAHQNLGAVCWNLGLTERSMDESRKAIELEPGLADAHYNLGVVYWEKGLHDEAIGEYKKAIEISPGFASARHNLGNAYLEEGLYLNAQEEFERVIEIDPAFVWAHWGLGVIYASRGLLDDAIAEYLEVIRIDPNLSKARCNLGRVYLARGSLDESIEEFKMATDIDANLAEAHYGLAVAYLKKGRCDRAQDEYQRAVEINPEFSANPYRLKLE